MGGRAMGKGMDELPDVVLSCLGVADTAVEERGGGVGGGGLKC